MNTTTGEIMGDEQMKKLTDRMKQGYVELDPEEAAELRGRHLEDRLRRQRRTADLQAERHKARRMIQRRR